MFFFKRSMFLWYYLVKCLSSITIPEKIKCCNLCWVVLGHTRVVMWETVVISLCLIHRSLFRTGHRKKKVRHQLTKFIHRVSQALNKQNLFHQTNLKYLEDYMCPKIYEEDSLQKKVRLRSLRSAHSAAPEPAGNPSKVLNVALYMPKRRLLTSNIANGDVWVGHTKRQVALNTSVDIIGVNMAFDSANIQKRFITVTASWKPLTDREDTFQNAHNYLRVPRCNVLHFFEFPSRFENMFFSIGCLVQSCSLLVCPKSESLTAVLSRKESKFSLSFFRQTWMAGTCVMWLRRVTVNDMNHTKSLFAIWRKTW